MVVMEKILEQESYFLTEESIAQKRQQLIEKIKRKRASQTVEQRKQAAMRVQEFSEKLRGIDAEQLKYEGIMNK